MKTAKKLIVFSALAAFAALFSCKKTSYQQQTKNFIVAVFEGTPKVAVFDTSGKKIAERMLVGSLHQVITDGKFIFVTSQSDNSVFALDTEKFEVISKTFVGKHPTHMDLSPDGKYLSVVNEISGEVSILQIERVVEHYEEHYKLHIHHHEEIARIPGFSVPHFARWTPDGKHLLVANAGAPRIDVLDGEKFTIVKTFDFSSIVASEIMTMSHNDSHIDEIDKMDLNGFFDVVVSPLNFASASYAGTGKTFFIDLKNFTIMKEIDLKPFARISISSRQDIKSYVIMKNFAEFFGGVAVVKPDGVLGEWKADYPLISNMGVEYGDKFFVLSHDQKRIEVISSLSGERIKTISLAGNPISGIYYDGRIWVTLDFQGKGTVAGINPNTLEVEVVGDMIDGEGIHGIHAPGAVVQCH